VQSDNDLLWTQVGCREFQQPLAFLSNGAKCCIVLFASWKFHGGVDPSKGPCPVTSFGAPEYLSLVRRIFQSLPPGPCWLCIRAI
jgi:hypothetical protein